MSQLRPCSSNQPWLLTSTTDVAIVRSGVVSVYARIASQDNATLGRLIFIGHAHPGMVMLPMDSTVLHNLTVVAHGSADAELEVIGPYNEDMLSQSEQVTNGVASWIDMLLLACEPYANQTSQHLPVSPDAAYTVSKETLVTAQRSPVWFNRKEVAPVGDLRESISPEIIPVNRVFPGIVVDDGEIRSHSTRSILVGRHTDSVLRCTLAYLHQALLRYNTLELEYDTVAFKRRVYLRGSAAHNALASFTNVTGEASEVAPASSHSNPVIRIAELIATSLDTPLTIPTTWVSTDVDSVVQLLELSRIRTRSVVLTDGWYTNSGFCMVGYHTDGRIVALLQSGSSAYQAHFADGSTEEINASTADNYMSNALQAYRPFPSHALKIRDILSFGLSPLRRDIWMVMLAGVAGGILSLFMPSITSVIFDQVIPMTQRDQLAIIAFGIVLSAIVKGLFDLTRNIAVLRIQIQSDISLQSALWDRLLSLPTRFFRKFTAGELATRASGFTTIQQLISGSTTNSLVAFIFSIFQIALLFYRSSTLAWYALLVLGIALALLLTISYVRYTRLVQIQSIYQKISGTVLQLLTAISKIRATASENFAFAEWARLFQQQRRAEYVSNTYLNVSTVINAIVPTVATMVFYWVIEGMIKDKKQIDVGDLLSFISAFTLFWSSMLAFVSAFESILMCIPLYTSAMPIFETLPEVDDAKPDPGPITGRIDFVGVTFRYDPDGPPTVQDLSFSIQPGEFVAIVGTSGSGKSTALRLLLGFEQPEAGSIYVDGLDIRDVNIRSIRRQMGVVMQNGKVLSGDIGKNIIGASATLTYDDAWEAARAAGFEDDVRDMPMGMHTVISEGGGGLSGGQRQRLLISRALAGKPRIVLMDEATSALDNRTQEIVTTSLNRMNVTRLVIAHRLSTIVKADRIIVMEKGIITEQGTYAELMARGGQFTELAKRQIA